MAKKYQYHLQLQSSDLGNNKIIYEDNIYKIIELKNFKDSKIITKDSGIYISKLDYWNMYDPPYYLITLNNYFYSLVNLNGHDIEDLCDTFLKRIEDKEFTKLLDKIIIYNHIDKSTLFWDFVRYYINENSYEYQLEAISRWGNHIKYIDNPSEELQLAAVTSNYYAIGHIKNPTPKVIDIANKKDGIIKNSKTDIYFFRPCRKN